MGGGRRHGRAAAALACVCVSMLALLPCAHADTRAHAPAHDDDTGDEPLLEDALPEHEFEDRPPPPRGPLDAFEAAADSVRTRLGVGCAGALLRVPEAVTVVDEIDVRAEDDAEGTVLERIWAWVSPGASAPRAGRVHAAAPLQQLAALGNRGDLRAIVCLAELRLFVASKRVAPGAFVQLPAVRLPMVRACWEDAAVAAARLPRCALQTSDAPPTHFVLHFAAPSDAIAALSVAACVGSERVHHAVVQGLGMPPEDDSSCAAEAPVRAEVRLDEVGEATASSPPRTLLSVAEQQHARWVRRTALLASLTPIHEASGFAHHNPALRVDLMVTAPYTLHTQENEAPVDAFDGTQSFPAAADELPTRWLGHSHVIATADVALRRDLALPLWDAIAAYQEATATLGLLHLGRARVRTDAWFLTVGVTCKPWQPEQLRTPTPLQPAGTFKPSGPPALAGEAAQWLVRAAEHAVGAIMSERMRPAVHDKDSVAMRVSDYADGIAQVFASDAAALDTLLTLARAGLPVPALVLAHRWLRSTQQDDATGRAAADAHALCARAVELLLPIAQDAVMDGSVASAAHSDDSFSQLWEAHEDAFVAAAAKETELNAELLREEAEQQGDAEAQVQLGELLAYGYPQADIPADPAAARRYFEMAAGAGHAGGMAQLGMMLLDGTGDRNVTRARELLEAAGAQGDANALAGLGYMYETGTGVPRNLSMAVKYLRQAADAGAINAHNNLGALLLMADPADPDVEDTDGVTFNASAAREHLEVAHAYGFAPAAFNLGLIEYNGWTRDGVSNCTGAAHYWQDVALRSRWMDTSPFTPGAAFDAFNAGGESDLHAATRQYMMLALLGSRSAQDNLGFLLEHDAAAQAVVDAYVPFDAAAGVRAAVVAHRTCVACGLGTLESRIHAAAASADEATQDSFARQQDFSFTSSILVARPRVLAHAWYAQAAHAGHAHALKAVADCMTEPWVGVPACDPGVNATLRVLVPDGAPGQTVSAAEALALLERSAHIGFGHAYFTLSHAYATGTLGSLRVARNISRAWEYLDYCVAVDALSDWPVAFARVHVLVEWLAAEAGYALQGDGGHAGGARSVLMELVGCFAVYEYEEARDRSGTMGESASPRSVFSSSADLMHAAEDAARAGEDADALPPASVLDDQDARSQRKSNKRHHLGPLPLTLADRQLCTVITRTIVAVTTLLALVLCVAAGYVCWPTARPRPDAALARDGAALPPPPPHAAAPPGEYVNAVAR